MPVIDKRGVNFKKEYRIVISYKQNPTSASRLHHMLWVMAKNDDEAKKEAVAFGKMHKLLECRVEEIKCQS